MTISFKKVGALLSSFLLILSCQPTIINTVTKETPKNQVLNNKTFSKKSLDCYIDYLPRSDASIISHSGGIVQYYAHMALANGKISFDSYVSVGPDGIPFNVEFNVGRLKDGDTVGVSGIGRQVYGFGSIGQSFGGKLWEIPLSGTVTLKDGKLNLKFSGNVANCTTGRSELAICGQNGSEQEPLGGSIEAEIPYNGCLSLELSRDVVSFNPDNDSEFNSVDLNVNASNFINSNLFAAGKIVKSGKGNYSETLNKDNHYDIPDGRHRVDVNGGYYQSDTKPLKVDSTPPEFGDSRLEIDNDTLKIYVKTFDPEVNGFNSGLDKNSLVVEGENLTAEFVGDEILCKIPIETKFNESEDDITGDNKFKIKIKDNVKNESEYIVGKNITKPEIEDFESGFTTKSLLGKETSNGDKTLARYLKFTKECNFKYDLQSISSSPNMPKDANILNGNIFYSIYRIPRVGALRKNQNIIKPTQVFLKQVTVSKEQLTRLNPDSPYTLKHILKWDDWQGKATDTTITEDGIIQRAGEILESGLYLQKTFAIYKYTRTSDSRKRIYSDFTYLQHPYKFRVHNTLQQNVGKGPYTFMDSDPTVEKSTEKEAAFKSKQQYEIYRKNRSFPENQKIILNYMKNYNNCQTHVDSTCSGGKGGTRTTPITHKGGQRLVVDDVSGQVLAAPIGLIWRESGAEENNEPKSDYELPTNIYGKDVNTPESDFGSNPNGPLDTANIDHIIPKSNSEKPNPEVKYMCCPNGTNNYSNAQVTSQHINTQKKNNRCNYTRKSSYSVDNILIY